MQKLDLEGVEHLKARGVAKLLKVRVETGR